MLYWFRVSLKPDRTGVLIRRDEFGDRHMGKKDMEAESRVTWSQAEECQ